MNQVDTVSFEELNAFVDGELDLGASARVLAAIDSNDDLKRQTCELRAMRDQLRHVYDIKHSGKTKVVDRLSAGSWRYGIAAGLLVAGVFAGWHGHGAYQSDDQMKWQRLAQVKPQGDRLLLHVGDSNLVRFENTLEEARDMLEAAYERGQRIELEILANGPGLDMLREKTTPVAKNLAKLQAEFPQLRLVACSQGLQRLDAQGADTTLLPGVLTTDSALSEIGRRVNSGWAYLRV